MDDDRSHTHALNVRHEQTVYATWMDRMVKTGFVGLVLTSFLLVVGWPAPAVPLMDLHAVWGLRAVEFGQATGCRLGGWRWVCHLDHGDILSLLPVAFLAAATLITLVRLVPIYLSRRDRFYSAVVILLILVLGLAISGLVGGGH